MSDLRDHGHAPAGRETDQPPPRPRWLKVLLLGILVVVLAFVVMHVLQGGGPQLHGPGTDRGMSQNSTMVGAALITRGVA